MKYLGEGSQAEEIRAPYHFLSLCVILTLNTATGDVFSVKRTQRVDVPAGKADGVRRAMLVAREAEKSRNRQSRYKEIRAICVHFGIVSGTTRRLYKAAQHFKDLPAFLLK